MKIGPYILMVRCHNSFITKVPYRMSKGSRNLNVNTLFLRGIVQIPYMTDYKPGPNIYKPDLIYMPGITQSILMPSLDLLAGTLQTTPINLSHGLLFYTMDCKNG